MKYQKFASLGLVSILLIGGFSGSRVNAESTSNLNDFEQVKTEYTNQLNDNSTTEALNNVLLDMSKSKEVSNFSNSDKLRLQEEVADSVSEETLVEYQEEKLAEIEDVINSQVMSIEDTEKKEYTLSDGSVVELSASQEIEDEDEVSTVSSIINMFSAKKVSAAGISISSTEYGPYRTETKEYGNRRYTAWVKLKSLGITVVTLKLVNRYSVGDYGLKMTEVTTAGTNGTRYSDIEVLSLDITDKKAEKVGYDMNAVASYKLNGVLNSGYVDIRSTIKLESLDKKKKTAKVYQRYQFDN
ncbi:MAG: hypothetical protein IJJ10_07405 [Bacillus sp. (in: Bacteria)]|nr:hypothetical protein [Bacillus sp. (in: firmicutes)]